MKLISNWKKGKIIKERVKRKKKKRKKKNCYLFGPLDINERWVVKTFSSQNWSKSFVNTSKLFSSVNTSYFSSLTPQVGESFYLIWLTIMNWSYKQEDQL